VVAVAVGVAVGVAVAVGVGVAVVVAVGVGVVVAVGLGLAVVVVRRRLMGDMTAHWRRSYDNLFLGAWDLWSSKANRYLEVRARIDRVTDDEVVGEGGRRSRPIQLHLSGQKGPIRTPMIVSKANGTTLQLMFGPIPAGWVGKEITIYVRKAKRVQKGTGDVLTIRNAGASSRMREELEAQAPPAIEEDDLTEGDGDAQAH
jgi:hypothetical protein